MIACTRSLTSFPDELLEMIISNLQRKDLKNLRLTCYNFHNLCTARLFQEIALLPIRGCLEGFIALLETAPYIATHIQSLLYNELWTEYLNSLQLGLPETFFGLWDMVTQEFELLKSVFRLLPKLSHVEVHGLDEYSRNLDNSDFDYAHTYVQQYLGPTRPSKFTNATITSPHHNRSASIVVLAAMTGNSSLVTSFQGTGSDPCRLVEPRGQGLPKTVTSQFLHSADGLKKLSISFNHTHTRWDMFGQSFAAFISTASNLECLCLDFNAPYHMSASQLEDEIIFNDPTKIVHCLNESGAFLKSLKALSVEQVVCKEKDLEVFLRRHAKTLRSLTIRDLSLFQTQSKYTCAVRFLERLRGLKLEEFTIEGELFNTGRQEFDFGDSRFTPVEFHKALRAATAKWVTGKTDRMPDVLERVAILEKREDFEPPPMFIQAAELKKSGLWYLIRYLQFRG